MKIARQANRTAFIKEVVARNEGDTTNAIQVAVNQIDLKVVVTYRCCTISQATGSRKGKSIAIDILDGERLALDEMPFFNRRRLDIWMDLVIENIKAEHAGEDIVQTLAEFATKRNLDLPWEKEI